MDFTESQSTIDSFVSKAKSKGLKVVEVFEPVADGLLIDRVSHPILSQDVRAIIFRSPGYEGFIRGIRRHFGTGGEAFLYYQGEESGAGFARLHKELAESAGLKDPIDIFRRVSTAMFQSAGFGRMEVLELGDFGGRIAVYDSFECELGKGEGRPYSAFFRGMIAGVLRALFGKEFQVKEVWCMAMGYSHCLFEVFKE